MKAEVVIVGGGPAGSSAGLHLLKQGKQVVIVDRAVFPREKICAGFIAEPGMQVIRDLGMPVDDPLFFHASTIRLYHKTTPLITYETKADAYVVNRKAFDHAMIQRFRDLGGQVIEGDGLVAIDVEEQIVKTVSGLEIHYEVCIGADGANSLVRKAINDKDIDLAFCGEIYDTKGLVNPAYATDGQNVILGHIKQGYSWVFEAGDRVVYGAGGYDKSNKVILDHIKDMGAQSQRVHGTVLPAGRTAKTLADGHVFLLGDAAGFIDPILGEGISYALLSGKYVAKALASKTPEARYRSLTREIVRMNRAGCFYRKVFFNGLFQKWLKGALLKHPNLGIRLSEEMVIAARIGYQDTGKILRLLGNHGYRV